MCDAVRRPPPIAFKDNADIRAFVEEMKAKGKIIAPVVTTSPDRARPAKIVRGGVSATDGSGAFAGIPKELQSRWMDITPALAAEWLRNNFVNRSLSDDTVDAYARDMMAGAWTRTHQGVAFNDLDELIDGQHRLHAIVKSGCTVTMMVTFGLPAKIAGSKMTTMDAVDRGKTRSVADQLKIQHGLKNGSAIAMVVKSIAAICSSERVRRLSVGQTLEIYHAFRESIDLVIAERPKEHGLKSAGVLAGFAFAMATERGADVRAEWRLLLAATCAEGTPLALLRAFLSSDEAALLMRGNDRALAELVLETLRMEHAGERPEKLELSTAGAEEFRGKQRERVEMVAKMFRIVRRGA